ncbi:MAG: TIGR04255 family protein [Acidobacteriota bacterium]
MSHRQLKNKPLVEATLEILWSLPDQSAPGIKSDPHYKMLLGRFYERVMRTYPQHDTLPAASLPEAMVAHKEQYSFRVAPGKYPLLQIGPGILSVHERSDYTWDDFLVRSSDALLKLIEAYPRGGDLEIESLRLHYLDAVAFDYTRENVFDFLRDKLKTRVELPEDLFVGTHVRKRPTHFTWEASFDEDVPKGDIVVRFQTGYRKSSPALLWETIVESDKRQLPPLPDQFESWMTQAHTLSEDWFFKLIAGDLERKFAGEAG